MVDWIQIIVTAGAVGFGSAIGMEVKDLVKQLLKRTHKRINGRNANYKYGKSRTGRI